MINGIRSRIYSLFNLVPGTVARPHNPEGQRALFYRDKKGQHWPLRDLFKSKLGLKNGPRISFLGTPGYYRSILDPAEAADPEISNGKSHHLPLEVRQLIFEENRLVCWLRMMHGMADAIWDAEGIKVYNLKVEPRTGTLFMAPRAIISPPQSCKFSPS